MKKFFSISLVLILFQSLTLANELPQATKAVTLLIYYSGDNNLSNFMKNSIDRISREGSSQNLHLVAQYDGSSEKDSLRLSMNTNGQATIHAQNIEYDMGKAQTLIDFVDWGRKNFPSEKLVLLIFGHGRGVLNVPISDGSIFKDSAEATALASSSDDTSKSYMDEEVLVRGLKKVLGSKKIDLVIYNSCLMGNLEVMNMFADVATSAIASVYPIYVTLKDGDDPVGRAISIENVIKNLKEQSSFNSRELAKKMLQNFEETYKDFIFPGGDPDKMIAQTFPSTLAYYELDKIAKLSESFSHALSVFQTAASQDPAIMQRFFEENLKADYVDSLGYIDMLIFYRSLMRSLNPEKASANIQKFEQLHSQVVTEKVALHVDHPGQLGHLSFFFPSIKKELSFVQRFQAFYSKIEVPQKYGWPQFLDFFWKETQKKSDAFWLSMLKKWSLGETVYVTANPDKEYADYYFFLELDVQAIKWAKNPKWMKSYSEYLGTIKRTTPEFQSHLNYVKSLSR